MNRRTYLAPGAQVVGDVTLGENVGIWYNAVVRGDTGSIFIDDNSNVQDNSTLHTDEGHRIKTLPGIIRKNPQSGDQIRKGVVKL